jgi:hypothetical protein
MDFYTVHTSDVAADRFYYSNREFSAMKHILILWNIMFLFAVGTANSADEINTAFPPFLDLTLY